MKICHHVSIPGIPIKDVKKFYVFKLGITCLFFLFLLPLLISTNAIAGGYKIPEQSTSSTALSAAYVANAHGPDSSYYNPANMVWEYDKAMIEVGLNYAILPSVDFSGTVGGVSADSNSRSENSFLPDFYYVSQKVGEFRFGLSLTDPFGSSKRWDDSIQKLSAEEFTLKVVELNPSFGYKVNDRVSIGGGIRGIYADGKVKSNGTALINGILPTQLIRDMDGNDISFGYNLALTFNPVENLSLATTYRSKVTPLLEGNGSLSSTNALGAAVYNGGGSVEVILPAALSIAAAYTFNTTTFEFVFERTFWGAYKELDFNYDNPLNSAILTASFDDPVSKNWNDSNTYRFGVTHQYNSNLALMAGFAVDQSPVPADTLGFELPDADGLIYSGGIKYDYNEKVAFGLGYLYLKKNKRSVSSNDNGIAGDFSSSAHLLNFSLSYYF